MLSVHFVERGLPGVGDAPISASEYLFWGEPGQAAVVVLEVLPLEVAVKPPARVRDAVETAWIGRLIFGRLKLGLTKRIVVADSWPAVAPGNAMLSEQVQEAVRDHR